jgi:hypothetical protein
MRHNLQKAHSFQRLRVPDIDDLIITICMRPSETIKPGSSAGGNIAGTSKSAFILKGSHILECVDPLNLQDAVNIYNIKGEERGWQTQALAADADLTLLLMLIKTVEESPRGYLHFPEWPIDILRLYTVLHYAPVSSYEGARDVRTSGKG